jgi:choline kinase
MKNCAQIYNATGEAREEEKRSAEVRKSAKKGKLTHVKFKNIFWYSIDSYKDMEECSKEIKTRKYIKYVAK